MAVDGRDHRLGAFFDGVDKAIVFQNSGKEEILIPDGLDLGDVGPGNEVLPRPRQDHRLDGGIGRSLHERIGHLPHEVLGELVHRRIVHIQNGDPILQFYFQALVIGFHCPPPLKNKSQIPKPKSQINSNLQISMI
jgi:hypothetical protein